MVGATTGKEAVTETYLRKVKRKRKESEYGAVTLYRTNTYRGRNEWG